MGSYTCDLCGKTLSRSDIVFIPLREMQNAVREGFNPFRTPGIDLSVMTGLSQRFGISVDAMFQDWRRRLMADTTDWGLCSACLRGYRKATQPAPRPAPKPRPVSKPVIEKRDYSELLDSLWKSSESKVEALNKFEAEVASDPDSREKLQWHASAHYIAFGESKNQGYLDKAIELWEKALEIDPKYKVAYSNLMGAYLSKEDHDGVLRTARRWAKVDPDLPQDARDWLREYEQDAAVPSTVEETVSKASALTKDGKPGEAVEMLEKAAAAHGDEPRIKEALSDALTSRAREKAESQQSEAAFQDLQRATQIFPDNWHAQINFCLIAERRGDFEIAYQAGEKAFRLNPDLRKNAKLEEVFSSLEKRVGRREVQQKPVQVSQKPGGDTRRSGKKWWKFWK